MKRSMLEFCISLATVLAITLSSATIAAAAPGFDTCVGSSATIGGTCTPLTNTTSENLGNTTSGASALISNTTGRSNTASGAFALMSNTTGHHNTASGDGALVINRTGGLNTPNGVSALASNPTGSDNTASGVLTLVSNTTGNSNTASGIQALFRNTTGNDNTASGELALFSNTTGTENTATGGAALFSNTTGNFNTAAGNVALHGNTTGAFNTAAGASALALNTTGNQNTGLGQAALHNNTSGGFNTATGLNALSSNTDGNSNTAAGHGALRNSTTGSNNIDIGNTGVAGESGTIRIGNQGTHTKTFVGGIFGSMVTGDAVVVSNSGQLGIVVSSARYKRDVRDMASSSEALMKLRPVTFRYKEDPGQQRQYGLVAEEVARVYPDLVSHDADGKVVSVHYHELVPMLLNEIQKLSAKVAEERASFEQRLSAERAERLSFEQRLLAREHKMQARNANGSLANASLGD